MTVQLNASQATSGKIFLSIIILLLLLFPALPQIAQTNHSNENNWNGTITYTYTQTSYHSAPYSQYMYHKWHHSYEQRMEAKLLNGKGIARSSVALLDTSYYREQTGSRTIEQWEIEKGVAQGTASTEASISIDQQRKTYSIEVPIPATTGNKIKTFLCKGCGQAPPAPVTTSLGEDETSIMVEDEKSGTTADVLSGKKTERKKIDNGEGEEITVTRWMLTRAKN